MAKYVWAKQKVNVTKKIKASHDPYKEWNQDPKGYFLIRLKGKQIEVGFVTNKHIITKTITGKNAIEIYNTIVRQKLLTRLEHAAYLGKELFKAEMCLRYGLAYRQEFALNLPLEEKVVLKVKS
ncbi:hypothetical protein COV20_01680 [Candidatus Woesearchaeota archaeon CG10_big_fil_rev_8_21_14_0_10_45_16]|nr:MAG: hypothetical protein COV20_01680 [Candidatus Woesearchaeota archaeon CG10_big_fil_rev_8_21_14_0_10_45_16]